MCSILFTNKEVNKANKLLERRGPDATSLVTKYGYTFLHTLLSLTGEYTTQPIEEDGIILLFNGEIYNFKDIDNNAKSDSYSIISSYKKHGTEFVKYLNGEFAIVLVDIKNQLIVFSSDVFKTKPLFYSIEESFIGISTFESPLRNLKFSDIHRVRPNTCYTIHLELGYIEQYAIKDFNLDQHKTTYDDWINAFDRSIKKRATQSDLNKMFIGLSSGYDSGAIACALNKLDVDNKCYSIYASENEDVINERVKLLKNIETIRLSHGDFSTWRDYVNKNCESFISEQYNGYDIKNDKASVGLSYICDKAIKEGRKIYLSGQGADEIFSDYGMFGTKIMGDQQSTFGGIYPKDLAPYFPWKNFYDGTMEMYIAKEEYIAGSFGIETRYPFLDVDVVQEFLWLTPELKNKSYKSVVYEYLVHNNFPIDINKKIGFQANRNLI